jgi:hypothetical protein
MTARGVDTKESERFDAPVGPAAGCSSARAIGRDPPRHRNAPLLGFDLHGAGECD